MMTNNEQKKRLGKDSSSITDANGNSGGIGLHSLECMDTAENFPEYSVESESEQPLEDKKGLVSDFGNAGILKDSRTGRGADKYLALMMLLLTISYDRNERSEIIDDRVERFHNDCDDYGIQVAKLYLARDVVESIYPVIRLRFIWCLETIGLHAIVKLFFG